jgi:hypothetical protein
MKTCIDVFLWGELKAVKILMLHIKENFPWWAGFW